MILMSILITLFLISKTQSYVPSINLSTKNNQNLLAKDFKGQFIGMNIKQNVKIKIREILRHKYVKIFSRIKL